MKRRMALFAIFSIYLCIFTIILVLFIIISFTCPTVGFLSYNILYDEFVQLSVVWLGWNLVDECKFDYNARSQILSHVTKPDVTKKEGSHRNSVIKQRNAIMLEFILGRCLADIYGLVMEPNCGYRTLCHRIFIVSRLVWFALIGLMELGDIQGIYFWRFFI